VRGIHTEKSRPAGGTYLQEIHAMWKALAIKELRDVLPIACLAMIAYLACAAYWMGYPLIFGFSANSNSMIGIPFYDNNFLGAFVFVSIGYTVIMALWQTVAESNRGTWLFLLHRPVDRRKVIGIKLLVGSGAFLLSSVIPILFYAAWAVTPGTHASPFAWWMTIPVWIGWLVMVACYLGAFLSGFRLGRWFGTRLLPLPAVGVILVSIVNIFSPLATVVAIILLCTVLVFIIFYIARTRDFS
jgi:hypothetical protein